MKSANVASRLALQVPSRAKSWSTQAVRPSAAACCAHVELARPHGSVVAVLDEIAIVTGPASVRSGAPAPRIAVVSGKRKRRRGMLSRSTMSMSTGPPATFICTQVTPLTFGVASQVAMLWTSVASEHGCVVSTTARFGPLIGSKSSVTTTSSTLSGNPGEA